jgi:hypothetical protein
MEELKLNVTTTQNEIIVRKGQAEEIKPPLKFEHKGNIDSVANFLHQRVALNLIDQGQCTIFANKEKKEIRLLINETNHYSNQVSGSLQLSEKFNEFAINTEYHFIPEKLGQLIKMNRSRFANIDTAMQLGSQLKDFKVKAETEVSRNDNNRGSVQNVISKVITDMNIPENFKIKLPIFKGQDPVEFEVEIYVRSSDMNIQLISYEAEDIIAKEVDRLFDVEIKRIQEIAPKIVIINQ